jgi:CubicO group peptidase (beta-lactamase class C family)
MDGEGIPRAIESYLRAEMALNEIPGAAVVVVRGDQVLTGAYGVRSLASGEPLTAETLLDLASLSKPLTALAVSRLREEGRLDLERPVVSYLPEFRLAGTQASEAITVRHLIEHRSGLRRSEDYLIPCCGQPGESDLRLAVRRLERATLRRAPGSGFLYANSNYILLAALVERVSGRPFPNYMQEAVFAPLGMTRTTLDYEQAARRGSAEPHEREWGSMSSSRTNFSGWYGSSQVKSPAVDVGRWLSALLRGDVTAFGPAGRAESFLETRSDAPYQTGWFVRRSAAWFNGELVIEHSGFIWNGSASVIVAPRRQLAAAVLMNTGTSRAAQIARGVLLRAAGLTAPPPARAPWTSQTDNWAMVFTGGSAVLAIVTWYYVGGAWLQWRAGRRRFVGRGNPQAWVRSILLAAMAVCILYLLGSTHRPLASLPGSLRVALPLLAVTSAVVLLSAGVLGVVRRHESEKPRQSP